MEGIEKSTSSSQIPSIDNIHFLTNFLINTLLLNRIDQSASQIEYLLKALSNQMACIETELAGVETRLTGIEFNFKELRRDMLVFMTKGNN